MSLLSGLSQDSPFFLASPARDAGGRSVEPLHPSERTMSLLKKDHVLGTGSAALAGGAAGAAIGAVVGGPVGLAFGAAAGGALGAVAGDRAAEAVDARQDLG